MQFLKNLNLKPINILKIAGLALVIIIIVTLAFRLIGHSFNFLFKNFDNQSISSESNIKFDGGYAEKNMDYGGSNSPSLSLRNVVSSEMVAPEINDIAVIDNNAEDFEVTEYNASIETRHLDNTCQEIAGLKPRDDVIFESSNEYKKNCNYRFKVENNSTEEILAIVENLNPKELNENTYTIKRLVDDYTSELEILENKMASIEETLNNAVSAYDNITGLATRTQDVESLANIIDSKIRIIERLTQEKININAQLERINRSKEEQLDKLKYTYFNIYVTENKFIDGQNLKNSWETTIKLFVRDINKVIQDVTVNLVSLLFLVLQYIIYLFILLLITKYCWKFAKNIWKR
jgi:hypothetical protein